MMMTINFGASKREEPEEQDNTKQIKKAAMQRRLKGMRPVDPDEKKKKDIQASTFGGSK